METFFNFIFTTIYGVAAVVAIVAMSLAFLKKFFTVITERFMAITVFVVLIVSFFTLSSIPLYLFDANVNKHIKEAPEWVDVISKETTKDIFIPITLFYPPVTRVLLTGPSDSGVLTKNEYAQYLLEPDLLSVKQLTRIVTIHCESKNIELPPKWSEAGENLYAYSREIPISKKNFEIYCERDWSREREALARKMLSEFNWLGD